MEEQQRVEIGQRIRELRETSPHTNESIAEHVGVGVRSVANWISGTTGITYANAKKVAELFEVDVRWLWDGKERPDDTDFLGKLSAATPPAELRAVLESLEELRKRQAAFEAWLRAEFSILRASQELPPKTGSNPEGKTEESGR
jgi:transcriptional regulator with XRE-family HTH domain